MKTKKNQRNGAKAEVKISIKYKKYFVVLKFDVYWDFEIGVEINNVAWRTFLWNNSGKYKIPPLFF